VVQSHPVTPQESFFLQLVRERALATERDLEAAVRLREDRGPTASLPDLLVGLGCINAAQKEALLAETRPRQVVSETPTLAGPEAATAIGPIGATPAAQGGPYPGYEVLEEIAHGGMGIVYKARQTALGRLVALKVLIAGEHASPELLERFHREARASAKLEHPNIVQVYDAKQDGNVHYFTMRLVDGLPLSHLSRGKGLPPRRALEVARKVALALDYAHRQGVIHRDVKPANILIDAAGEPHVADFGLAKDLSTHPPGSSEAGLTVQGSALGTPSYASPEQVGADSTHIDARTDVYGLGATLYEMLTGRPPFVGESVFTIVADVLGREPDAPRALNANLHRDIETICLKAMEKDPARRYATAADLAEDVRRYLEGEPILARPVSGPERLWRKAAKHRAVVIPSIAAVLIASGWGGWWAWSASERREVSRRAEHAEEALGKAERVSRVLARWSRLADGLRSLEAATYDASLTPEERLERVREPRLRVAAFLAATPDDAASQAAAVAFAAWAWWLSGEEDRGIQEMRRAASIDTDVPYGALYEGLARLTRLVESLPLPRVEETPSGIRTGAIAPETPGQARERQEVVALLERARAASVWGKEGAAGLGAAIEALSAMRDGDWARADAGLSRALETPDLRVAESGLYLARARSRYLQGDFDAAQEDLAHVLRARPESAEAYKALAEIKLGQVARLSATGGDLGTQLRVAIDALGQTLQRAPRDAHAFKIRGCAYRTLGNDEALHGKDPRPTLKLALDDLDEAIRLAPGSADAWGDRGVLRQHLAEWLAAHGQDSAETLAKGEKDLSKAIELDPANVTVLVNRGSILIERSERESAAGADPLPTLEKALADLSKAIRLEPRQSQALNNRGLVHYHVGLRSVSRGADPVDSFRKALAEFDAALAVEPGFVFALNNQGLVGRRLGEWQAAHQADPKAAWNAALAALDAAIALNPDYPLAHQNRGDVHWSRGEWEMGRGEDAGEWFLRAEGDYGRVLVLNPESVSAYNSRASVRWRMAEWEMRSGKDPAPRLEAAAADYAEAIRRNPTNAYFYNNRGNLYWTLGEWKSRAGIDPEEAYGKALVDFGEAVRIKPTYAEPRNGRGIVLWRRGEWEQRSGQPPRKSWEKAIAEFDELLKLAPDHVHAPNNRGNVWSKLGDLAASQGKDPREAYAKAEADFQEGLGRGPRPAEPANGLGLARLHRANWENAHAIDARATYEAALEAFGEALARNPRLAFGFSNRSEAWRRLGDMLASRGEDAAGAYAKAIEDAERAAGLNASDASIQRCLEAARKALAEWEARR